MRSMPSRWRLAPALLIPAFMLASTLPGGAVEAPEQPAQDLNAPVRHDENVELTQIYVKNVPELERLVALDYDLTSYRKQVPEGIEVHVLATPDDLDQLRAEGFGIGGAITATEQLQTLQAERARVLAQIDASDDAAADELEVLRADWFDSIDNTGAPQRFLNVEVVSSMGADSTTVLTVDWEGAPAPLTMSRFVDAGVYLYHRFSQPRPITDIPDEVTITSSEGGTATVEVEKWLGETPLESGDSYATGFVDRYLDPTESQARMVALAREFPDLAEIIDLPHLTNGYRRHAQLTLGTLTNHAFYLTSHAWGHEGGNDITAEVVAGSGANAALDVTVSGSNIRVSLGTNADGASISTGAQVVEAINADPQASALVEATLYRGNNGSGIFPAVARANLSDGLSAPDSVSHEPFQTKMLRIGKHRDGSKVGIFAYGQEHAREWVTPLVTVETAERLLRNYKTDPQTRKLVDNVDIFLIASANPDGGHYSMYDFAGQRKNLTNHCGPEDSDPARRTTWGVDINRNYGVGTIRDGFSGASYSCTSATFTGPAEYSEPETKNIVWVAETFPNIKFSQDIHSYGGYFMWSPGSYKVPGRVGLERPSVMEEDYFYAASSTILSAVQQHRGNAVHPGRTGPISDVLYSAAGSNVDEFYYNFGIYAFSFEVGMDLYNPQTDRWQAVGFQPPFAEGYEEAMEFANGLVGMVEVARAFQADVRPPRTTLVLEGNEVTFESTDPVTIHYTLDGSRPTYDSPMVVSAGVRRGAAPIVLPTGRTQVSWFAVDPTGNVENRYRPNGTLKNFRKQVVNVPPNG